MRAMQYTIVVRGRLSERFASAFPGVSTVAAKGRVDGSLDGPIDDSGVGETRIDTEPLDLSQFYGLLERLRDLAVEVVSVQERATPDVRTPHSPPRPGGDSSCAS